MEEAVLSILVRSLRDMYRISASGSENFGTIATKVWGLTPEWYAMFNALHGLFAMQSLSNKGGMLLLVLERYVMRDLAPVQTQP